MDTDDLTPMAYETMMMAFRACEPMRAEIGVLASDYATEDDFLIGVSEFLEEILEDPKRYLETWDQFDENVPKVTPFRKAIRQIRAHVRKTLRTPRGERGKPPFEE